MTTATTPVPTVISMTTPLPIVEGATTSPPSINPTTKPEILRIGGITPGNEFPWEAAPAGTCDNCCTPVDEYHCLGTKPYAQKTFHFPNYPSWELMHHVVLRDDPRWQKPLTPFTLCKGCVTSACLKSINGNPPDHATGHHALNSWLYDTYGLWVPPNYKHQRCTRCNETHDYLTAYVYPADRICVDCFVRLKLKDTLAGRL